MAVYCTTRLESLFIIALMLTVLAGCISPAEPGDGGANTSPTRNPGPCAAGTERYEDPDGTFSLCIPEGWAHEEGLFGAVVTILPEEEVGASWFVRNVNIYTEPIAPGEGLESAREDILEFLPMIMTDWELHHDGATSMGGLPALEFRFTATQGVHTLSFHQSFVIHEGLAYAWTYTTKDAPDATGDPDVEAMKGSFRFL